MKKNSKRLVYVLSTNNSNSGHSLGVNATAVDPTPPSFLPDTTGILYSAGRDGIIHSWALENVDVTTDYDRPELSYKPLPVLDEKAEKKSKKKNYGATHPLQKQQIHTNWVNDIILTDNYKKVASCSSDLTVKLWDPHTNSQTLVGQHQDYVKCLATPSVDTDWIASGGLDRKIIGWDLAQGKGQKFSINATETDDPKASIYALSVNREGLVAAGGPESVVRLYDSRTAKQVVKFVGHTDNIRSVLVSNDGQWVLSGSSDSTVKLWSVTASRLLHTFDMHDDSVWSLFSNHENLDVFYSADRSGLVCKTDLRACGSKANVDSGICTVICNEHQGVSKIVAQGEYLWTSTSNSCIHRWSNVDTTPYAYHKSSKPAKTASKSKLTNLINPENEVTPITPVEAQHVQQQHADTDPESLTSAGDSSSSATSSSDEEDTSSLVNVHFVNLEGGPSLDFLSEKDKNLNVRVYNEDGGYALDDPDSTSVNVTPWNRNAVETLEGHIGLIKHRLLTDKRRVLVLDTSGEIKLWDIMQCKILQGFGSGQDIDDLADQLNALDMKTGSISNWCQVAVRSGELYVSLEEHTAFDAEVYADEQGDLKDKLPFKEDHRINLGRWMTKNLLNKLIEYEVKKDRETRLQGRESSAASVASVSDTSTNRSKRTDDSSSDGIQKVAVPVAAEEPAKESQAPQKTKFMGRLRGFAKGPKKEKEKPPASAAGTTASSSTTVAANKEPAKPEHSMLEIVQELIAKVGPNAHSAFTPPPAEDAPPLDIPPGIKIMLSEQSATAGGTMDLYRGTVGTVGDDAAAFEKVAPEWLANAIFKNELPTKEGAKVGFTLQPLDDKQPPLSAAAVNLRLTAYQMLRARKVLIYLLDKLDSRTSADGNPYNASDFELFCQGRPITGDMTLVSIRTKIWRSGGDVIIKYRLKQ